MVATAETHKETDRVPKPLLDLDEVSVGDLTIRRGSVSDEDVAAFLEDHKAEKVESQIDFHSISRFTPDRALVYKIVLQATAASDIPTADPETLAGLVYLIRDADDRHVVEFAYLVAREYQGKRIATNAVGAIARAANEHFDLVASIDDRNQASQRLAKRLGFSAVGAEIGFSRGPEPGSERYIRLRGSKIVPKKPRTVLDIVDSLGGPV